MTWPGVFDAARLADGSVVEYWDGGDPSGPAVVVQPGTPNSRWTGLHLHSEALAVGVRVVCVSRPGYGSSTFVPPGLTRAGELGLELTDALDLGDLAVLGVSGGGPYALAMAALAGSRVRAVGVAAGVAEWPVVDEPTADDADERRWLEIARTGDVASATDGYLDQARLFLEPLLAEDDAHMVAGFLDGPPAGRSRRHGDPDFRAVWAADLREALGGSGGFAGYVRDNLSWGMPWDVDLGAVSARVLLWYGAEDRMVPPRHGHWLADRLPRARLEVRPGDGHGATVFDHVPDMLHALTEPA